MADAARPVFPPLAAVRLYLHGDLRGEFEAMIRDRGWTEEEGVKILLAYAAAAARGPRLSPDQSRDELGAARGELSVLRHRAFMADDGIKTLRMNVTGYEKSLEQFARTLPRLRQAEQELQARLERLLAEAIRLRIELPPEEDEHLPPRRSFIDFYRRHARQ